MRGMTHLLLPVHAVIPAAAAPLRDNGLQWTRTPRFTHPTVDRLCGKGPHHVQADGLLVGGRGGHRGI